MPPSPIPRPWHHLIIPLVLLLLSGAPAIATGTPDVGPPATLSRVKRWDEFPENATFTFDCAGRPIGFYADLEYDCMIFHLCDAQGRRIPFMCDENTAFNQRFRVCDWAYNVDCESSEDWYYLNDLTYRP